MPTASSSLLAVSADSVLTNHANDSFGDGAPRFPRRSTASQSEPPPGSVGDADSYDAEDGSSRAHTPSSPPPRDAPLCAHIVLLTAARHGSTWFVDSADNCRYSSHIPVQDSTDDAVEPKEEKEEKYSSEVFSLSELWSVHEGPLKTIEPTSAAEYVEVNGSVKLLPPHAVKSPLRVLSFFEAVREREAPVVILRRDLADSWASLIEAEETGNWAVIRRRRRRRTRRRVEEGWEEYKADMKEYFEEGKGLLREVGLKFDELWYEDVVGQERIWLEKAACYVRNCNFKR